MLRTWTRIPRVVALSLVAMALAISLPAAAFASTLEPFRATFAEHFTVISCPTGTPPGRLCAESEGRGVATGLGPRAVTETLVGIVDFAALDASRCAPEVATGTLTAADGDLVSITSTGTFCLTSSRTASDTGSYTITGGTGRFKGAQGSGTYESIVIFDATMSHGRSFSTYDGQASLGGNSS